ncbi:Ktr system potassium uptake protein B [Pseudoalteromonas sp. THAF3]|uniref:TrkH family potassium uptake protein n=1 Tax=Pseudoalteromonas sp. THAF3 TaxID=2587843 RepID=UPI00126805B2|nr:TrkH family potassium uptake protein [Pseudoalteromonas sp. THAF3]QFU06168.1 Ktr system potassium uptake protein B [Pseudoalteromonas sp. THAF3]
MKNWLPSNRPYSRPKVLQSQMTSLSPASLLIIGFAIMIAIGTCLLLLPMANNHPISLSEALFTATSAVTVTGLIVVDTGSQFSDFGQWVIAALIQFGGLGFMTFAVVILKGIGIKLDLKKRLIMREGLAQTNLGSLVDTAKAVIIFALTIEAVAIVVLTCHWQSSLGWERALHNAIFYTISAFNNAGFALHSDSLTGYRDDWVVNGVISGLFIVGGLGFLVLIDVIKVRKWQKFSLNSKVVIVATCVINVIAMCMFLLLEWHNTLAAMPLAEQLQAAWFQAVTPRTAGFNTLDMAALNDSTTLLMMLLMLIGGGSMSTASGLKIGTVVIMIVATYASLRQRSYVNLARREIANGLVYRAFSLFFIYFIAVFVAVFALAVSEQKSLLDIVFEVVSAVSTVGLSRGLTGELSAFGEGIIIVLMVVGRIGPLTFLYLLAKPKVKYARYAPASLQVG